MFLKIYGRRSLGAIALCVALLNFTGLVRAQGDFFGYVVIEAPSGRIPAASALFSLRVGGTLISEAGVAAVTPIRRGRVFVDRKGTETGLAMVNPSGESVTATLVLRDSTGAEVCRTGREIEAFGHLAKFVPELFTEASPPCASLPSIGSLTIETAVEGPGLASVTLRQSTDPNRPVLATLPVAALEEAVSSAFRQQESGSFLVFPQIGAGPLTSTLILSTQIILINRATQSSGGEIELFDSNGEQLALKLELDPGSELEQQPQQVDQALLQGANGGSSTYRYDLQPDGVFRGTLTTSAQVSVGYAVVTPDPGNGLPVGTAVFQYRDGQGGIISEAGVAAAAATRAARIFVDTVNTSTGVAIALPGEESASVSLDLLDRNGFPIQKVTRDLGAGEHFAKFPAELFRPENLPAGFTGLIEIRSDVDIHIVTLKLTQSDAETQGLPILTTLPLADLDQPVAAASAILPQVVIGSGFSTRIVSISQDGGASSGTLRFIQSTSPTQGDAGVPSAVPLLGSLESEHEYHIPSGGGRQSRPGNTATVASIELPELVGNEIPVQSEKSFPVHPQIIDSAGEFRDDFEPVFESLDPEVATVDAFGLIEGKEPGFSSLTVFLGEVSQKGTIFVMRARQSGSGAVSAALLQGQGLRDLRSVVPDSSGRVYLSSEGAHTVLRAEGIDRPKEIFAGVDASLGFRNGPRLQAQLAEPAFLAQQNRPGGTGTLYVSDSVNNTIRQVELDPVNSPFEGNVSTLAGTTMAGGQDGGADEATFNNPKGIALARGFLWVVDSGNHTIRRIRTSGSQLGQVETLAGEAGVAGCQDGNGNQARFTSPTAIALEPESIAAQLGTLLAEPSPVKMIVTDTGCGQLRRVDQDGNVTTVGPVASTTETLFNPGPHGGAFPNGSCPCPLDFVEPEGVSVDFMGNIYVSEPDQGAVWMVQPSGNVVLAAQGGVFSAPRGLFAGQAGQILAADGDGEWRQIDYGAPEIVSVVPEAASVAAADVATVGTQVTIKGRNFADGSLLAVGGILLEDFLVVDSSTIRFVAPEAFEGEEAVTVLNRGGLAQIGQNASGIGFLATAAELMFPFGVTVDGGGDLYIGDTGNHSVRKVDLQGIITTEAGTGTPGFSGDGNQANEATLVSPYGVVVDGVGNLYFADSGNFRIRRVDSTSGIITTVAGTGDQGFSGDNGQASAADLDFPSALTVDDLGNLYFADSDNHRVRKVDSEGIITTVAGTGEQGFSGDGNLASGATFNGPRGLAVDGSGNLYIADTGNSRIRKVDSEGIITTVAGTGEQGFSGDMDEATKAALNLPLGVAVDGAGNLYIGDTENHRIRKVDSEGIITTVAGGGAGGEAPLPATDAVLNLPTEVVVDGSGNLYFADTGGSRIGRVDAATGIIEALAGTGSN